MLKPVDEKTQAEESKHDKKSSQSKKLANRIKRKGSEQVLTKDTAGSRTSSVEPPTHFAGSSPATQMFGFMPTMLPGMMPFNTYAYAMAASRASPWGWNSMYPPSFPLTSTTKMEDGVTFDSLTQSWKCVYNSRLVGYFSSENAAKKVMNEMSSWTTETSKPSNQDSDRKIRTHSDHSAASSEPVVEHESKPIIPTSRFRGVLWDKLSKSWRAKIKHKGKTKYLGVYQDEERAARAYDQAAVSIRGHLAILNFPDEHQCREMIEPSDIDATLAKMRTKSRTEDVHEWKRRRIEDVYGDLSNETNYQQSTLANSHPENNTGNRSESLSGVEKDSKNSATITTIAQEPCPITKIDKVAGVPTIPGPIPISNDDIYWTHFRDILLSNPIMRETIREIVISEVHAALADQATASQANSTESESEPDIEPVPGPDIDPESESEPENDPVPKRDIEPVPEPEIDPEPESNPSDL